MFKVETIRIVGETNSRWGQTFYQDGFFLVLEIEGKNLTEKGHEVIEKIIKAYQALNQKNLKSIKKMIFSLNLEKEISLVLGVFHQKVLYLISIGQAQAFLKREKAYVRILKENSCSSGIPKNNDLIIFTSPSFQKLIPKEQQADLIRSYSWEKLEETLASIIKTSEKNEGVACLIIRFLNLEAQSKKDKFNILKFISRKLKAVKNKNLIKREKNDGFEKKRRLTISIGFVLTLLLISSLVFGNRQRIKITQERELKNLKENVLGKIEEGKSLADLNTAKARQTLLESKSLLQKALPKFKENSKEYKEVKNLLEDVNKTLFETKKDFKIKETPLFFDLTWIKEQAKGNSLSLYKDSLVILDRENKNIYKVSLENKKSQIIVSDDVLASAEKITAHGKEIFILIKDENSRVINSNLKTLIEKDQNWEDVLEMKAYAGNLYLLDKKGAIWKYPRLSDGFGKAKNYLSKNITPDFSQVSALSIDGSVWVLNQKNITKFTQGTPQNFSLQDLEEDLKEPSNLFTNEQSNNLYVFDKQGKIVVFDKQGKYQAQYSWDKFQIANDFVVLEKLKKILVLIDSKIYTIEIR